MPDLWDDTLATATWKNAAIVGLAGAGAIALRTDIDRSVRADVAEHPQRWGHASSGLRVFGEPAAQAPALFAVYGYSIYAQDEDLHEFSVATIHAWGLSSLTTVAVKGIADTQRPTNRFLDGRYGFPSFHTSSTFSIAAVIEDYYGWKAGLPAYAVAGLVGWSRIDQQEHDLSDVLFGAVLGYVIGKSVAAAHQERHTWEVQPWIGPQNTSGLVLEVPF